MAKTDADRAAMFAGYQLRLPTYEGPLDVLLRLIERSQLAVEDVSLVRVTDQFLAFIATLRDAPPEIVADFTAVGARLAVLKSRSLLPRPATADDEVVPSDITEQLREYKRMRDAAGRLAQVHAAGLHAYSPTTRGAIAMPAMESTPALARHEPAQLVRSLRRRLAMVPKPERLIRQRRVVSLREMVIGLSDLISRERSVAFSHAIAPYRTRTEVATAFLGVLILIRRQTLVASQDGLFSDISLASTGWRPSNPNGAARLPGDDTADRSQATRRQQRMGS